MAEDGKRSMRESEYTTLAGTVDREEEERLIEEERQTKRKAEEAEKTRPPSLDTPGAPPQVHPETGEPVELLPGRPKDSMMPGKNPPRPDVPTKGAIIDD